MADASEWTEELVAEYFELRGYAVVRDLPTTTGSRGGRSDADVIAFKSGAMGGRPGKLTVVDAEAGTSYRAAVDIAQSMRTKFSPERKRLVLKHVSSVSGQPTGEMTYRRMYFDFAWMSEKGALVELARELGSAVQVIGIEQLVNAIAAGIVEWKLANVTAKGNRPSLPERFPALQIVLACMYCWGPDKPVGEPIA